MPIPDGSCAARCAIGRARFLRATAAAAFAGVAGAAFVADPAFAQSVGSIAPTQSHGSVLTYALPSKDGALVDAGNGIVIARVRNAVYAMSMTCPHRAVTRLEWLPDAGEFHCPKHDAHFQSDGALIDGRPDRAMDRYAVRIAGRSLMVDTGAALQQDTAHDAWSRAVVTVG